MGNHTATRTRGRASAGTRSAAATARGTAFERSLADNAAMAWVRANPEEAIRQASVARYKRDAVMKRIVATNGGDGPPKIVSRAQLDDLVADGAQEWYHGFASENGRTHAESFMRGDYQPGRGTYGSGFYTGIGMPGLAAAHEYSMIAKTGEHSPNSAILRGAMLPSAKIYAPAAINRDFDRDRAAFNKAHPAASRTLEQKAFYEVALNDLGRYAALKGYDAVGDKGWGLIINRSATAVQRSLIPEYATLKSYYAGMRRNSLTYRLGAELGKLWQNAPKGPHGGRARTTRAEEDAVRQRVEAEFAQREQARLDAMIARRNARQAHASVKASA